MIADMDALRASLGTVSNINNSSLERALAAATAEARREVYDWAFEEPAVQESIILDAARLYKRRMSPEGVAGWGDLGVVRITSRDPDVDRLRGPYIDMTKAGVA